MKYIYFIYKIVENFMICPNLNKMHFKPPWKLECWVDHEIRWSNMFSYFLAFSYFLLTFYLMLIIIVDSGQLEIDLFFEVYLDNEIQQNAHSCILTMISVTSSVFESKRMIDIWLQHRAYGLASKIWFVIKKKFKNSRWNQCKLLSSKMHTCTKITYLDFVIF